MEEDDRSIQTCAECNVEVLESAGVCPNCGATLPASPETINVFNNLQLRQLFFFYFGYLFVCFLVKYTSWFHAYHYLFWIEILLAVITLGFAWITRKQLLPVLKFTNFKWLLLLGVLALAIVLSFVVSYTVREVNITFFKQHVSFFKAYRLYYFPTFLMIYSIALMPAIFEELTFRGVMHNLTASFLNENYAIFITAILFAIMHLSLISMIWLLPFGVFLGFLRKKYNTIWYGVAFHFTFNFTAVLIDLYQQGELNFISF